MGYNGNKRHSDFLGMAFGTASARLRKMILLDLLKRHKENVCYRCGLTIESRLELSIEHKKPWLGVDAALFWDLNNIAFSHMQCNASMPNEQRRRELVHGTLSGYCYRGCRCQQCREAGMAYQREYLRKRRAKLKT